MSLTFLGFYRTAFIKKYVQAFSQSSMNIQSYAARLSNKNPQNPDVYANPGPKPDDCATQDFI